METLRNFNANDARALMLQPMVVKANDIMNQIQDRASRNLSELHLREDIPQNVKEALKERGFKTDKPIPTTLYDVGVRVIITW